MNWLLIVVIVLLLGYCWYGYKTGVVKMTFSVVCIILSLFLTSLLTPVVRGMLRNNEFVYGYFRSIVVDFVDVGEKELTSDEQQQEFIKSLSLPTSMENVLMKNNSTEIYKERGLNKFQDYLVDSIVELIINAISFIIVYFLIRMLIVATGKLLDVISKMPILNSLNKNVGIAVGLVQGLLITWLIFVVIFIGSSTSLGQSASMCIGQSSFLTFLYENNVLMNLSTLFI